MATTTLRTTTGYRSGLYEWLTTTDHKKIGILYLANSILMFLIGGALRPGSSGSSWPSPGSSS